MAQFDALLERHHEAHRRAMVCAGTVAAAIYNANPFRGEGAKAIDPLDFVPEGLRQQRPRREQAAQSLDQQISLLTKALGPPN